MELRRIKQFAPLFLSIAIILIIAVFSDTGICVFRRTTGLPCPSCGMTRAYMLLFTGNLKEAFIMHPLFPLIPLIAGLMLYSFLKKVSFTKTYIVIGVLFIVVYIVRMIFLFPDTYPFNYEYSSLFWKIFIR